LGGILIIAMLSYLSRVLLGGHDNLEDNFSFLIMEADIFSSDISFWVGKLFIFLGAFALFGVQLGIFDFLGRLAKTAKKYLPFEKESIDEKIYKIVILIIVIFGLIIFSLGFSQPKFLIVTGAVLNAFSMGVIALLLFLIEKKLIEKDYRSFKIMILSMLSAIFYFAFFVFVVFDKLF
jgi:hypothetical protein